MGIDLFSARFLRSEARRGVSLGHMLTLGRQTMYMSDSVYESFVGGHLRGEPGDRTAEPFLRALGAVVVDSMDISAYEGCNILHDLNQPVGPQLRGKYDCVFDGGALEHVFNFPTALKNCMEMVKVGGYLISITPTNNYSGHGFYQFSPELFYAAFSPANGYIVERMLLEYEGRWFSVREPVRIGRRIELMTTKRSLLFISAKRTRETPIFKEWPQQSDYVAAWRKAAAEVTLTARGPWTTRIPGLQTLRRQWHAHKERKRYSPDSSDAFEPVDLQ